MYWLFCSIFVCLLVCLLVCFFGSFMTRLDFLATSKYTTKTKKNKTRNKKKGRIFYISYHLQAVVGH
jgi:hypothetical protein